MKGKEKGKGGREEEMERVREGGGKRGGREELRKGVGEGRREEI